MVWREAGAMTQYELACRMQSSVPELMDLSREPQHVLDDHAADSAKPNVANRCCSRGGSSSVVRDAMHVHDLQATILHLLGLDHERLTFRLQGRDYRLTDVSGKVVNGLLA